MMALGPPAKSGQEGAGQGGTAADPDFPAFDAAEFAALSEMIGEDGVMEMVTIFDCETRQRMQRLAAGGQSLATVIREMHTLKGAAGTVAAPRLKELGAALEQAARQGVELAPGTVGLIEAALRAYLDSVRAHGRCDPVAA